jgi:hypothetical protein
MILVPSLLVFFLLIESFKISDGNLEDIASLYPEYFSADDGRYLVLIIETLGLANRLRAMADWYIIARQTSRELIVSWRATDDCNAAYTDLFIGGPNHFQVLSVPVPLHEQGIKFIQTAAQRRNISYRIIDDENRQTWMDNNDLAFGFLLKREIAFTSEQVLITTHNGLVALENMPCQLYVLQRSKFYQSLKVQTQLENLVNSLFETYFQTYIPVGIHIRTFNPVYDWAVVPSANENMKHAEKFNENLTTEDYIQIMQQIYEKFAYQDPMTGLKKSAIRFFLASNTAEEKQIFGKHFDENVIYINGEYDRNSTDGIQFALIEWLLLSKMGLLIHTHGSSFAEEAAMVYGLPLVGLTNNKIVMMKDSLLLPHCGSLQFSKVYGMKVKAIDIVEGTFDQRQVKAGRLEASPCSHLAEWGLDNIYCLSV